MASGSATRSRIAWTDAGTLVLLIVFGLVTNGCGAYGTMTRAGVGSGDLDRILKNPKAFIAYASAPSRGIRAGQYVALFWDIRSDKFTLEPEKIQSQYGHRWTRIPDKDVIRVYRGIVNLDRQHETTKPVLYRVLSGKNEVIGYFFSAVWGSSVAVIRTGPHQYSIRPVHIGQADRHRGATLPTSTHNH